LFRQAFFLLGLSATELFFSNYRAASGFASLRFYILRAASGGSQYVKRPLRIPQILC
jgi:hypothetical protein